KPRLQAADASAAACVRLRSAAGIDVRARPIERQRGDAGAELCPLVVLRQILFDVRKVKGRDGRAVAPDEGTDRPDCCGPGKVTDDRNDQVLLLKRADRRVA